MSKHRVKSVALDDDIEVDYDYDDDEETGFSEEDKHQMRVGTINVREALGGEFLTSDEEIQDALWHYYYDVTKSVSYIRNKQAPAPAKTPKSAKQNSGTATPQKADDFIAFTFSTRNQPPSDLPVLMMDFFEDSPWLQVPQNRKAEILIEPRYPQLGTGLLGGASNAPSGKVSKLAALAASRRKKENTPTPETGSTTGLASLRKLRSVSNRPPPKADEATSTPISMLESETQKPALKTQHANLPIRRTQNTTGVTSDEPSGASKTPTPAISPVDPTQEPEAPRAKRARYQGPDLRLNPSGFASTLLGNLNSEGTENPGPPLFHAPGDSRFKTAGFDLIYGNATKDFDFSVPSSDGIIANARKKVQSSLSTPTESKSKSKSKTATPGMTASQPANDLGVVQDGMNELVVEPAKIKSRNIDVLAEYKKTKRKNAANFVVIGHVDAGKSTLMGRLLLDLNAVDQRTIDKYRREAERIGKGSFALAWVLDQGSEERARGVTIDIATNKFETEKTNFTILDAPGHRDFVPNMIAGVSQADFAVLVIDAGTGNFESGLKGQTKEHALVVRSMGVQKLIVVVNKMDSVQWSHDRFAEIQQQISSFLTVTGFQPKNVTFIPCSGLQGDNIARRSTDSSSKWYTGPTLVEELETSEPTSRAMEKPLRMTIGDVFRSAVQNPLSISGRLDAGSLQIGDQIGVMPSGERASIKSIDVDQEPSDWAVAGQNVTLNLTDINLIHLKTGDIVCSLANPIKNITSFTAKILAFEHLTPMHVEVLKGRLHVAGRIAQLVATLDKGTGNVLKKRPKVVQPGSVARVLVELDQAVPLEAPSRVVLRANGETVAAGLLE